MALPWKLMGRATEELCSDTSISEVPNNIASSRCRCISKKLESLRFEGLAGNQRQEQIFETVSVLMIPFDDLLDLMPFCVVWNAAGGVDHELLRQALRE